MASAIMGAATTGTIERPAMSGLATFHGAAAPGWQHPAARLTAGLMLFALLLAGLAGGTPPETAKSYTVVCGLRG